LTVKSVIEAVREAIFEEMARDPKVFVMGEDVGIRGGVFLATQGLAEEFGDERIIDAPLAEASIMGIALGASFSGMRPIPEIQFSDFVWPSINQLIGEAARTCYGTNGAVPVPMVIRMPYGGGIRGGLFHSQNVETHFFHTPGLKVVAPCTPYDAKGLLKSAIRDNNPVVFLEHKKTYRLVRARCPTRSTPCLSGRRTSNGWGAMSPRCPTACPSIIASKPPKNWPARALTWRW